MLITKISKLPKNFRGNPIFSNQMTVLFVYCHFVNQFIPSIPNILYFFNFDFNITSLVISSIRSASKWNDPAVFTFELLFMTQARGWLYITLFYSFLHFPLYFMNVNMMMPSHVKNSGDKIVHKMDHLGGTILGVS